MREIETSQGARSDVTIARLTRILTEPAAPTMPESDATDEVDPETAAALDRINFMLSTGQRSEPWSYELDD
jgi:hypothetical protein